MDQGTLSGIVTGLLLLTFVGIVAWAWNSRRTNDFAQAARLPLEAETSASHGENPR